MARVVKKAVYGTLPSCGRRTNRRTLQLPSISQQQDSLSSTDLDESSSSSNSNYSSSTVEECSPRRREGYFTRYEETSSDEDEDGICKSRSCYSRNFADLVAAQSLSWGPPPRVTAEYGTRHLLVDGNFRENWIRLGEMNKIFCSQWLNERQIVFGSKCNQVIPITKCIPVYSFFN